jgi:hypothetical protein
MILFLSRHFLSILGQALKQEVFDYVIRNMSGIARFAPVMPAGNK